MDLFPVFLFGLLVFVNRYFLGLFLKRLKGARFDAVVEGYEPEVTIVVPMFNEGQGIYKTILSLLEQDYPEAKLRITVVDDCSTDDSYKWACKAAQGRSRVTVLRNPRNVGKRMSINHAVREAATELVVSVDSDVVVDRHAVRTLVTRFTGPEVAAVGGQVLVSNPNENWLTQMQTIKYFFGYRALKSLERSHRTVMCLSGCLTAYRRDVLLQLEPILENRNLFGVPIKYGEDRFLTRQIVKAGYRTVLTLEACCFTVVPNTMAKYFSQQLRWRRSNTVDYLGGVSHAWRLPPLVSVHYLSLAATLTAYPAVVLVSLIEGAFWHLAMLHLGMLSALSLVYWLKTRTLPKEQRVSPLSFLAMALIMPTTYVLLSPLALLTLDSGSWETRGKPAPAVPEAQTGGDARGASSDSPTASSA